MEKFDVTALGELLIDFTENGLSAQGNQLFEANPGGAPCNVLAMLTNLGHATAFIGKVGDDALGRDLKKRVTGLGIETRNLILDPDVHTTLAFVHTMADGDRDFSFYRNPGADMMLEAGQVDSDLIAASKIFHFGTLSMTHEKVRQATMHALEVAKRSGCLISFDPNLREPLWESLEDARQQVLIGLGYADILKISDNEIVWLTGKDNYHEGVAWIKERFEIKLILVSLGKEGSMAFYGDLVVEVPSFVRTDTIETTGAGDTFCASVLHHVLEIGIDNFDSDKLGVMLRFANAAASIITTRKGALMVMPTVAEIEAVLQ